MTDAYSLISVQAYRPDSKEQQQASEDHHRSTSLSTWPSRRIHLSGFQTLAWLVGAAGSQAGSEGKSERHCGHTVVMYCPVLQYTPSPSEVLIAYSRRHLCGPGSQMAEGAYLCSSRLPYHPILVRFRPSSWPRHASNEIYARSRSSCLLFLNPRRLASRISFRLGLACQRERLYSRCWFPAKLAEPAATPLSFDGQTAACFCVLEQVSNCAGTLVASSRRPRASSRSKQETHFRSSVLALPCHSTSWPMYILAVDSAPLFREAVSSQISSCLLE